MDDLRIGVLGAARITPVALLAPARALSGVTVATVAARDPERARRFAAKRGIPHVARTYDELLADPSIDAVYNPLPNGLHGRWTIAAIEAGKHVLCEKPFTANAAEAEQVKAAADSAGVVVMEAFHYRYHPLAERMREVTALGALGQLRHVEMSFCIPILRRHDIRWDLALAGGATMDVGSYAVHIVRLLGGAEPEVVSAQARLRSPGVDRWMQAELRFPSGVTGRITCSMLSTTALQIRARATGTEGTLSVFNPVAPQFFHRFTVKARGTTTRERFARTPTYRFQLEAFRDAVRDGRPVLTGPGDAVANMRVIDAMYRAAGLEPRQPTG